MKFKKDKLCAGNQDSGWLGVGKTTGLRHRDRINWIRGGRKLS